MTPPEKWRQVVDDLLEEIKTGKLKTGDALPGVLRIQDRWKVSNSTAVRALRELVDIEVAHAVPGRGTFVTGRVPPVGFSAEDRITALEQQVTDVRALLGQLQTELIELYNRQGQPYPGARPAKDRNRHAG